jgi:NRAMP (natural resistance-associated macrophage protein)-like metal ion transporter
MRLRWKWFQQLGPGLITGASDDDPSGIATYSQAGAQFGSRITWTMLLTYPLMAAIQEICGRIGRTTGCGIAQNIRKTYSPWLLHSLVWLLAAANVINIGADLGAMGDTATLLLPGPRLLYVGIFAVITTVLQVSMPYERYAAFLKWLALSMLSYFASFLVIHVHWTEVARGFFIPRIEADARFWAMVIAIFGTTISPYLFFWQASQEVEEIATHGPRQPLRRAPGQAASAFQRIRLDTYVGMGLSNLIGVAIMIATASTLHVAGVSQIESSAQAAQALEPIAGPFAFGLFALSIISTGLLSIPVLAGSAASAIGESLQWKVGLRYKPSEARAYYATLLGATAVGVGINLSSLQPIRALVWAAVLNGIVAVPMMVTVMLLSGDKKLMGDFRVSGTLRLIGWLATVVMALASAGFFYSGLTS